MSWRASESCTALARDGCTSRARTFISNIDPKACVALIGPGRFPRRFQKKVDYEYSVSSYTLYLGVKGLDLREFGFGSWNIWHYPHLDINRAYEAQTVDSDLSIPGSFCQPQLFTTRAASGKQDLSGRRTDPRGCHRLRLANPSGPPATDRAGYRRRKKLVAERSLDSSGNPLHSRLAEPPGQEGRGDSGHQRALSASTEGKHLRFGLDARQHLIRPAQVPDAAAEPVLHRHHAQFPSVVATVVAGSRLYTHLTGDPVNPGRDMYGLV